MGHFHKGTHHPVIAGEITKVPMRKWTVKTLGKLGFWKDLGNTQLEIGLALSFTYQYLAAPYFEIWGHDVHLCHLVSWASQVAAPPVWPTVRATPWWGSPSSLLRSRPVHHVNNGIVDLGAASSSFCNASAGSCTQQNAIGEERCAYLCLLSLLTHRWRPLASGNRLPLRAGGQMTPGNDSGRTFCSAVIPFSVHMCYVPLVCGPHTLHPAAFGP